MNTGISLGIDLDDKLTKGSDFSIRDSKGAIPYAEKNGWHIVLPMETQLLIDIDDAAGYAIFQKNYPLLQEGWDVIGKVERPSKSGGVDKKHITVTLKDKISPLERIALQAILGSDTKRELFSLVRLNEDDPHPTLLFEKVAP